MCIKLGCQPANSPSLQLFKIVFEWLLFNYPCQLGYYIFVGKQESLNKFPDLMLWQPCLPLNAVDTTLDRSTHLGHWFSLRHIFLAEIYGFRLQDRCVHIGQVVNL